jgi:hypothetical protein
VNHAVAPTRARARWATSPAAVLALVFTLFAGAPPAPAHAVDDYFTYDVVDSQATITGYSGDESHLVVPATVWADGRQVPVIAIGDNAFDSSGSIDSITFPASIVLIGNTAFNAQLTSATFVGDAPEATPNGPNSSFPPDTVVSFTVGAEGFYDNWLGYRTAALSFTDFRAEVRPGLRTVTLGAISFDEIDYSFSQEDPYTTEATLGVNDMTGSGLGWQVTLTASDLVWTSEDLDVDPLQDIPAENLTVSAKRALTTLAGQDPVEISSAIASTLDNSVQILTAQPGFGQGHYSSVLTFELIVPALARAGSYESTITMSTVNAP